VDKDHSLGQIEFVKKTLKQITGAGNLFYSGLAAMAVALFGHSLCARAVATNVTVESFDFIQPPLSSKLTIR